MFKENPCEAVKTYFNAMYNEREKKTFWKMIVAAFIFCVVVFITILIVDCCS